MSRGSLYWDDFKRRITETVESIQSNIISPVRRVAVFITDQCNFKCNYCNHKNKRFTLSERQFSEILEKYGDTAIIHITGGEPSVVPWLYSNLESNSDKYRFHLNTNAYILPPYKSIKRLKVSLDHHDPTYWDHLVGRRGAFNVVLDNIRKCAPHTVTSITCTLTKQNYRNVIDFTKFINMEITELYAVFFSVYKGTDPRFVMDSRDAEIFFNDIIPELEDELSVESLALFRETIDEKRRLIVGERFPQNRVGKCYLSMSERVISPTGEEYYCSHLYRDGIYITHNNKHPKCLYGCNRRLIKFNETVEKLIFSEPKEAP